MRVSFAMGMGGGIARLLAVAVAVLGEEFDVFGGEW